MEIVCGIGGVLTIMVIIRIFLKRKRKNKKHQPPFTIKKTIKMAAEEITT
jgi:hypothetical protein